MKKLRSIGVIAGFAAVGCLIVLISIYAADRLTAKTKTELPACHGKHTAYQAKIKNSVVAPQHIQAVICDSLTITNLDDTARLIAFGRHDDHVAYDGIEERWLSQGQSLTITLNQAGNYTFHDHTHDQVTGSFTVK